VVTPLNNALFGTSQTLLSAVIIINYYQITKLGIIYQMVGTHLNLLLDRGLYAFAYLHIAIAYNHL